MEVSFFSVLLQDGATALFKAAHKGHTAVIEELLKYRPNLGLLPVRKIISSFYSLLNEIFLI